MSPILLRPSREQDEHDRLVRHLHGKYSKKKFDVSVNVRDEQLMPVRFGPLTLYPDIVFAEGNKLAGVAEVETGESVNNLEALAQWAHFGKAKVPFHLYVPVHMYEAARRLMAAVQAKVTEVWTYRPATEGFDLVRMYADANAKFPKPSTVIKANPPKPVPPPPPPPPPKPEPVKVLPVVKGRAVTGKTQKVGLVPGGKPGIVATAVPAGKGPAKPVVPAGKVAAPAAKVPPAPVAPPVKIAPAAKAVSATKVAPKPAPKPVAKPAVKTAVKPAPPSKNNKTTKAPAAKAKAKKAVAKAPARSKSAGGRSKR